jgi:hypothetical protein
MSFLPFENVLKVSRQFAESCETQAPTLTKNLLICSDFTRRHAPKQFNYTIVVATLIRLTKIFCRQYR